MALFGLIDDWQPRQQRLMSFSSPFLTVRADSPEDVPTALDQLENLWRRGKYLVGYFSYELGYVLEPRLRHRLWRKPGLPLLWFAAFNEADCFEGQAALRALGARVKGRAYAGPLVHDWAPQDYERRFLTVHDFIRSGDVYQTNLSFRSRFSFVGDPFALYCQLRERSHARYGAYVDDGERTILSLSPELFFEISSDQKITVRPMKGTMARRGGDETDEQERRLLALSTKDRAENLMIVDLLRNDLSRLAVKGSVTVDKLYAVETYPTLHQMVSTVTAKLPKGFSLMALMRAIFPCGSVTGAPKVRAMEIIRDLEDSPRGIYCGAVGFFGPDGRARFNVAIRTLTIGENAGELGVGGGIVHDSLGRDEFRECLLKSRFFEESRNPVSLIETMRFRPGAGIQRQGRHLDRLEKSALLFGIPFDRGHAERELQHTIAGIVGQEIRVRIALNDEGRIECECSQIQSSGQRPWTFVMSDRRVMSTDALAQHKSSWRLHLDRERERLCSMIACDEVVFLNEKEELVEGSRTNIFVKLGGKIWTPPLAAGCLDGCLRQDLIQAGCVGERTLYASDLGKAEAVFLGNSMRGMICAQWLDLAEGTDVRLRQPMHK